MIGVLLAFIRDCLHIISSNLGGKGGSPKYDLMVMGEGGLKSANI